MNKICTLQASWRLASK